MYVYIEIILCYAHIYIYIERQGTILFNSGRDLLSRISPGSQESVQLHRGDLRHRQPKQSGLRVGNSEGARLGVKDFQGSRCLRGPALKVFVVHVSVFASRARFERRLNVSDGLRDLCM